MKTRLPLLAALAVLIAGSAAPALADPITLTFNGPDGFGLDPDEVAASELDVITLPHVGPADPFLVIFSQDLGSVDPFPAGGAGPHHATSTWRMTNPTDMDQPEAFILFVTAEDFSVGGAMVSYADDAVGLTLDPDAGWVVVNAGGYLYPALGVGPLGSGIITDPFAVNYYVDGPLTQIGQTYYLPKLRIGLATVPEPGTFALVGLGLALMAATRRRRP